MLEILCFCCDCCPVHTATEDLCETSWKQKARKHANKAWNARKSDAYKEPASELEISKKKPTAIAQEVDDTNEKLATVPHNSVGTGKNSDNSEQAVLWGITHVHRDNSHGSFPTSQPLIFWYSTANRANVCLQLGGGVIVWQKLAMGIRPLGAISLFFPRHFWRFQPIYCGVHHFWPFVQIYFEKNIKIHEK